MRKNDSASKFLFVMVVTAIFLASQVASAVEIMPVKDIKPGMKGYGYTVYKGTVPQEFKFEVLGVDKAWNTTTDSPVVLVKLTAGPKGFPPKKTGVVAGMSGSPMYINGKLVGALAYGFGALPKDAIAGIQPAENMLTPYNKMKKARGGAAEISDGRNIPLVLSMPKNMADLFVKVDRFKDDPYFKDNFVIKPSAGALSAAAPIDTSLRMRPGSSLNVYIVKGDITLSANGTVTMVEGDQIYAFGHPFFGLGEVEMPFHQASVITTLSDYLNSYKMAGGDVGTVAGTITNDYYSAIKGKIGKTPRTLAMGMEMEGEHGVRTVNVEIAQLPKITIRAMDMVVFYSIYQDGYLEVGSMPAGTAQEMTVKTKIKFDGLPSIAMTGTYDFKYHSTFYSDDLFWAVGKYVNELDSVIAEVEKKGAISKIKSISLEVVFAKAPEKKAGQSVENVKLKAVTPKISDVAEGDIVSADLDFSTFESEGKKTTEYTMTVRVPVPKDAAPDSIVWVSVGNGTSLMNRVSIKDLTPADAKNTTLTNIIDDTELIDGEDLTLEEAIQYYNNLFQPGLFMRLVYEVADNSVKKNDLVAITFGNFGSSSLVVKKTKKTKMIFYAVPMSFTVNSKSGMVHATLTVKEKTKKEPITKNKYKWFGLD